VKEQQVVEGVLLDREQPAALVHARVGGAGRVVEQGHFSENLARPEHRQGFFAHARDVSADPHLAFDDHVQLVAHVTVLEDLGSQRVRLLAGKLGDQLEPLWFQTRKQPDFAQLLDTVHRDARHPTRRS
jgi:hypothetical protein